MKYSDGSLIQVGHIVTDIRGPERYLVLGPAEANFVNLLLIGTVTKKDSPSFGETIILTPGYIRQAPANDLSRLGSARIKIVAEDPVV